MTSQRRSPCDGTGRSDHLSSDMARYAWLCAWLVACGSGQDQARTTPDDAGASGADGGGQSSSGGGAGIDSGGTGVDSGGAGVDSAGGGVESGTPIADGASADAPHLPVPPTSWMNATANLAGMPSECGNLTLVSAKPKSNLVIAGVARHGLYATLDGGKNWSALGTGAGSATIINRPSSVVYDPAHTDVFWESGIYNGGGVYQTIDNGVTFKQLGTITHNDLVSVDFSDPQRKTLLVGGHEQKQTLYRSTDNGATWTNVGTNMPLGSHFSSAPLVIDGQTHLVGCCGWGTGTCGIWRSTNGAASWTQVSTMDAVSAPLWATSGTMYWALIYNRGFQKSADMGQHWASAVQGNYVSAAPIELPDGRLVAIGADHLMVSVDGSTWTPIGDPLPYKPNGATYSAQTKTFFVWRNDCGNAVLPNAIMSAGFDYQVH
jgi:hypothetical protein